MREEREENIKQLEGVQWSKGKDAGEVQNLEADEENKKEERKWGFGDYQTY